MNETIRKFGYPKTLIADFTHWLILLRPAQPTLGALILAEKSEAKSFGNLDPEAHAELAFITRKLEQALSDAVGYQKLNYLMLMMVDPHVHFHVIPRYDSQREYDGLSFPDAGWPGQPDLGSAVKLDARQTSVLKNWLQPYFA